LYAAYYVAELLGEMTDDDDPHPDLFDLADQTLAALATGESVAKWLVRFELGALRLLGHAPSLDACVECGTAVTPTGRVAFGLLDGGVLCPKCRAGKKQVVQVNAGVLRSMTLLADPNGVAWRRMEISSSGLGEMRALLNHYFAHLLGHRPRMYEYLRMLGK
jgi:DNA repair protein RecO (recombination protein O)